MTEHYRQCLIVGPDGREKRCWLPESIVLHADSVAIGTARENWVVSEEGAVRISEAYLLEHERDHRRQREASDI